ncbi:33663_t:CDS:1, partial [Racocetra persica]
MCLDKTMPNLASTIANYRMEKFSNLNCSDYSGGAYGGVSVQCIKMGIMTLIFHND